LSLKELLRGTNKPSREDKMSCACSDEGKAFLHFENIKKKDILGDTIALKEKTNSILIKAREDYLNVKRS